jgi:hypothetical protein
MFPYQNQMNPYQMQPGMQGMMPQQNFQSGLMAMGQNQMSPNPGQSMQFAQQNKPMNSTPQGNFLGGNIGQYRQG